MKLGLYTITYLGLWYRARPLRLKKPFSARAVMAMTASRSMASGRTAIHSTCRRADA